jgi:hypothetical protein
VPKNDMTAARLAKEAKARERAKQVLQDKKNRLKELKQSQPKLQKDYVTALSKAVKLERKPEEMRKAFNKADQLQAQIIGTVRAISNLEKELNERI